MFYFFFFNWDISYLKFCYLWLKEYISRARIADEITVVETFPTIYTSYLSTAGLTIFSIFSYFGTITDDVPSTSLLRKAARSVAMHTLRQWRSPVCRAFRHGHFPTGKFPYKLRQSHYYLARDSKSTVDFHAFYSYRARAWSFRRIN